MVAEQMASEGYKAVELVVASGIGGIIGTIVTFYTNHKLQSLKHKQDKQFTVHKLQFSKEFELYCELWKALVAVRRTVIISSEIETRDGSTSREKYEKAREAFNEAKNLFEDHRPFYHDNVSKITKDLLSQCRKHIVNVGKMLRSENLDDDVLDQANKLLEKVPKAIYEIGQTIQARIGTLQEAEIIE